MSESFSDQMEFSEDKDFFLWENKPFGSYYVSYGLTLSLVEKFQKGFLIKFG